MRLVKKKKRREREALRTQWRKERPEAADCVWWGTTARVTLLLFPFFFLRLVEVQKAHECSISLKRANNNKKKKLNKQRGVNTACFHDWSHIYVRVCAQESSVAIPDSSFCCCCCHTIKLTERRLAMLWSPQKGRGGGIPLFLLVPAIFVTRHENKS